MTWEVVAVTIINSLSLLHSVKSSQSEPLKMSVTSLGNALFKAVPVASQLLKF